MADNYFGNRAYPRGIRNNNPGNIEAGPFTKSQPGYLGSDGRFAKFDTMEHGMGAAKTLVHDRYAPKGLDTVEKIINRWAPPRENNTRAYIDSVSKTLGVDPRAKLDLNDPNVQQALIVAKSRVENGPKYESMLGGKNPQTAGPMPAPVASPATQGSSGRAEANPSQMKMSYNPSASNAPMQYAQNAPPKGSVLNELNHNDPSGPLRGAGPAPVTTPSATPQQIAHPQLVNNLSGLGMSNGEGVVQAPRHSSIMNNFPMNIGGSRDMMGETPYAMNMSGMPMTALNNDPVPVDAMPTTLAAQPNFGIGSTPTTGGSEVTPSYEAPSTTPDAGFTPTTPGSDGGGGDMGGSGDMLAGLADALGNLGGGGEGGGGGGPQLANPSMNALTASASMPDFPQLGPQFAQLLGQRGQLTNQPVPFPSQLAQGFNLKPIGQAGMQPQAEDGQAPLATKRLFT